MQEIEFRVVNVGSSIDLGEVQTVVHFEDVVSGSNELNDRIRFSIEYKGQPKHKVGDRFKLVEIAK